ncbi:MAG: acyl-ACP--UDP-N-acetylglucosamine O-acyltransferase [Bacteroidetes bacterium]|nr:acyl-ACP--UDP-N-acetylglucosamine O-acyltransferase [Bacteroidota bacterium]
MNNIHSTAVVSPKAKLGDNITVGPYVIIYDNVEIGNGCNIGPHAVIYDGARIGERVIIHQSASVSNSPQDLKYAGEETLFYIGDDTVIRECVTLHRGTVETGVSKIGKNCLLMAYTHVAHDCIVGDRCIMANGVQLGGHVVLDDWVIIGGMTPVHQFCKIGAHAMIGGGFKVTTDVPPFILAAREPLRFEGLNVLGLRRRGFSNEEIGSIKKAYEIFYSSGLNYSAAKQKMKQEFVGNKHVDLILNFFEKSTRSILRK